MAIKTKDNIEMKMEQYVKNDKLLAYLKTEYLHIMEQLASEDYPKSVAQRLSKVYLYWRRKLSPKRTNAHVKKAFEKVKSFTEVGETEMLREIDKYFKKIEDDKRNERYKKEELERYTILEIPIERLFKAFPEASKTQSAYKNFKKALHYYDKLLSSNQGCDKFITAQIKKDEIEIITGILARLSRKLLYDYREKDSSFGAWQGYSSIGYDYGYWQDKGYEIGYIYILTNKYMPGLVKVGMTTDSPTERAKALSRGKINKEKILAYLNTEFGFIRFPEVLAEVLSKATGVPGNFQVEYERKTVIGYKIGKYKKTIEKIIHEELFSKLEDFDNIDLNNKEFFIVPSVKYAIIFVEEWLDNFDSCLLCEQMKGQ